MSEENEIPESVEEIVEEAPAGEFTEVFKEPLLDEESPSDPIAADALTELDYLPEPNENPNPILAVEEMLDEATLEDSLIAALPAHSEIPTFQLSLALKPEQKEVFKKIATSHGIDTDSQIISTLTEYQAIRLGQDLRLAQIYFTVDLHRPDSQNSEDDLALGSLVSVPDPDTSQSESAPSVKLPKNEKGVLLFTGNEIPGFLLVQTLGIVTAHRALAKRFFRDDELQSQMNRELAKIGGTGIPKSKSEALFRELFFDLQKNALSQGGNAVISTRIEAFPETNHLDPGLEQMRLVAIGTAAVVEKITV